MSIEEREILVMGLPAAGKTTFIAALWHVVSSKEVPSELQMQELQPSRDHLNDIAKRWRECAPVGRTILGKDRSVTMNLETLDRMRSFHLTLPDTSGEAFQRMFENRRWSASFGAAVERSVALMFFIHPDALVPPQRIDDGVEEAVDIMEGIGEHSDNTTTATVAEDSQPWEPNRASPQAKILDLLQLVIRAKGAQPFRVAIIISAWDLVKNEKLTPEPWLEKRAPLVWQFLNAHKDKRPYAVFGISAQGNDYAKHANELREFIRHSDRISVVSEHATTNDITKPLLWAVG
jgi:GTPase SAR1 family protein